LLPSLEVMTATTEEVDQLMGMVGSTLATPKSIAEHFIPTFEVFSKNYRNVFFRDAKLQRSIATMEESLARKEFPNSFAHFTPLKSTKPNLPSGRVFQTVLDEQNEKNKLEVFQLILNWDKELHDENLKLLGKYGSIAQQFASTVKGISEAKSKNGSEEEKVFALAETKAVITTFLNHFAEWEKKAIEDLDNASEKKKVAKVTSITKPNTAGPSRTPKVHPTAYQPYPTPMQFMHPQYPTGPWQVQNPAHQLPKPLGKKPMGIGKQKGKKGTK